MFSIDSGLTKGEIFIKPRSSSADVLGCSSQPRSLVVEVRVSLGSQPVAVISLHLDRQAGIVRNQTFCYLVPVPSHTPGSVQIDIDFSRLFNLWICLALPSRKQAFNVPTTRALNFDGSCTIWRPPRTCAYAGPCRRPQKPSERPRHRTIY